MVGGLQRERLNRYVLIRTDMSKKLKDSLRDSVLWTGSRNLSFSFFDISVLESVDGCSNLWNLAWNLGKSRCT